MVRADFIDDGSLSSSKAPRQAFRYRWRHGRGTQLYCRAISVDFWVACDVSDLGFQRTLHYKQVMSGRKRYRRRHRVRFRNARKLKLFLLALGFVGIGLGVLLIGYRIARGDARLGTLGLIYLLGATSVLAARQGMIAWETDRKRSRASVEDEPRAEATGASAPGSQASGGES